MTRPSVVHPDKSTLRKWFGPNRGTHWTVAGSVALIIICSYLIYSDRF